MAERRTIPRTRSTATPADNFERRAPGAARVQGERPYQVYATTDGHVLFMASEQAFWKNFCEGVDRSDLFTRLPGSRISWDHAVGNTELQTALIGLFGTKSSRQWIVFGNEHNVPIGPVNTPRT